MRRRHIPELPPLPPYALTALMSITAALAFSEGEWGAGFACVSSAVGWAIADYRRPA